MAQRDLLNRLVKQIRYKKKNSTIVELGYSSIELKEHLEKLFTEGMSWNNYGEWHIDHKFPLSKFAENTSANIINALSNLRPLWKEENLRKYNHI